MADWKASMQKTLRHLASQLSGIRSGTISPTFVETICVESNGQMLPMRRIAVLKQQGDRILVTPFDKAHVAAIVRSLVDGRLNAYALNPTTVSVSIPPLSVEQRQEMVRHVKTLGETARVAIRAIRQDARKTIDATGRGSQRAVQDATNFFVAEIDQLIEAKIADLEA